MDTQADGSLRPAGPPSPPPGFSVSGPAQAEAVILLHGVFFGRGTWQPQVERLSARYRVIAIDLPGHGDLGDRRFALGSAADWVVDVLEGLGVRSAVVVGLSLGGYVAIEAARRRPGMARALVLSGASTEPRTFLGGPRRRVVRALGRLPPRLAGDAALLAIRALYGRDVARVLRAAGPSIPQGMYALASLPDEGFRTALASFAGPVLLLDGARDRIVRSQQRSFLQACQRGRLARIPAAGHLSPVERPEAYAGAVNSFVAHLADPPSDPDAPSDAG